MYQIKWTSKASKQLQNLPHIIIKRIWDAIDDLKENPFQSDIKKLSGQPFYRLRVGDYRVIFDLKKKLLIILILEVGHRNKIYDRS